MEVNNTDNEDLQNDNDLQNHPLIRLMMRSINMIPAQNENDILIIVQKSKIKKEVNFNKPKKINLSKGLEEI